MHRHVKTVTKTERASGFEALRQSALSDFATNGAPVHHHHGLRISFRGAVTYVVRDRKPEPEPGTPP